MMVGVGGNAGKEAISEQRSALFVQVDALSSGLGRIVGSAYSSRARKFGSGGPINVKIGWEGQSIEKNKTLSIK